MSDASWDNQGMGEAPRSGMPTWAKVLLGCGVVALLLVGACVGGVAWLGQKAKKDPEGFKRQALGFAIGQIRPDYERATDIVKQLQSDAGCRELWQSNPDLQVSQGSEAAFLTAAATWRPHLQDLPPLTTEVLEQNRFDLTKEPFGGIRFGARMTDGSRLRMAWRTSDRRLTLLEFTPGSSSTKAPETTP